MLKYKSELDVFTSYSSDNYVREYKDKDYKGLVYVHQNNSDLAAGLEMIGYKVIKATSDNVIQNTIYLAKDGKKRGINCYIIDSLVMENGELQAPFSLIGYIRVYDPYTPILALSYDTNPESVQSAFRYGATAYLPRPQHIDLVEAVIDGLMAAYTVTTEAIQLIEEENARKGLARNGKSEMIKISDSMYLDYGGRRLAFLDADGAFTFSEVLSDAVVKVLHCLLSNRGKSLSALSIGRLLGEVYTGMDWRAERNAIDRITANINSIKRKIAKYDIYKTIKITSVQRLGTTLEVYPPDEDAIATYALEKKMQEEQRGKAKGKLKSGFKLISLMEENSEVKKDKVKGSEPTLEELL
jgi:DNA-binding response OmpR family regulator